VRTIREPAALAPLLRAAGSAVALATLAGCPRPQPAATPTPVKPAVEVRFVERSAREAPWTPVGDAARLDELHRMLADETAQLALALYAEAWALAPPPELAGPVLYLGVEEGGNHVAVGLTLADGTSYPELPYVRIEADPETFANTLLHEGGHAIHALLGRGAPAGEETGIAPIPHSTAAVTDRRTAFNEGFAIHLEAVNAHCAAAADTRAFYDHGELRHGPTGDRKSEYYFPARDVMTYAQTFARYQTVRDGLYAFEPAARGDYLRVQLDPARDLRTLRDPGSMVASEGFVASVLYQVIAAGGCARLPARYRELFSALRAAETGAGALDAVPLLDLVVALGAPAIDVFLDLSRGVSIDPEAAGLWAQLYDAAIALDLEARDKLIAAIEERRARWRSEAAADPAALARRIGPVVPVVAAGVEVGVALFGPLQPFSFDANAAGPALLGLVPGWTAAHVATYLAERDRAPFADAADLTTRLDAAGVPTAPFR
jgi:hypothetical protein